MIKNGCQKSKTQFEKKYSACRFRKRILEQNERAATKHLRATKEQLQEACRQQCNKQATMQQTDLQPSGI